MFEGIVVVVEDVGDVFLDECCWWVVVLVVGLVDGICKFYIGKG